MARQPGEKLWESPACGSLLLLPSAGNLTGHSLGCPFLGAAVTLVTVLREEGRTNSVPVVGIWGNRGQRVRSASVTVTGRTRGTVKGLQNPSGMGRVLPAPLAEL